MTAATTRVPVATVPYGDDKIERQTQFATPTTYYPGQMMALNSAGAADHATDTAGLKFDGILAESDRVVVFSGDTTVNDDLIDHLFVDPEQDLVLAREVVVERRFAHAGFAGLDLGGRRVRHALGAA